MLDALHPEGMPGVLAEASRLFGDPPFVEALGPMRRRLGKLGARSSDAEVAALAADVAAVLASAGVDGPDRISALVDLLLTDRLNPTQQRFMHELRTQLRGLR